MNETKLKETMNEMSGTEIEVNGNQFTLYEIRLAPKRGSKDHNTLFYTISEPNVKEKDKQEYCMLRFDTKENKEEQKEEILRVIKLDEKLRVNKKKDKPTYISE